MSTSDQQGNSPLTRKQLREIRLTGTTPVISEEEAAAAAAEAQPVPAVPVPRPAEPIDMPPTPVAADSEGTPLTRRQAREQERIRTASVPVISTEEPAEPEESDADASDDAAAEELVSGLPTFAKPVVDEEQTPEQSAATDAGDDDDEDFDAEAVGIAPVSAVVAVDFSGEASLDSDERAAAEADGSSADEHVAEQFSASDVDAAGEETETEDDDSAEDSAADDLPVAEPVETGENHVVSPTFGNGLLADKSEVPSFAPSFDELITADSGGSQHLAPNTLIFNPSPGGGSLSGPVASTGEILVTGSYELPRGIGSQGHAHGAADGKETDAVLIDGELPPSSSPTPIAASSAISTIKPAGEVIRPPAPEKGNKLMLTLAITAGGLALALAVALIVAFTMNIFS